MLKLSEKYINKCVEYYIENVEIPQLEESIEFYEGLAMEDPKYIDYINSYKKELNEYQALLDTL